MEWDQRKAETGGAFDKSGEQERRADENMREVERHLELKRSARAARLGDIK